MSGIYKLRKSECEKLADIFSITLDPSKYTGLNNLHSELDKHRKILVFKLRPSEIVTEEIVRQIDEAREADSGKDIEWNLQLLQAAVQAQDKATATLNGVTPEPNSSSKTPLQTAKNNFTMTNDEVAAGKLDELISAVRSNQDRTIALPNFEGNLEDDIQEHVEMFEKLCTLNKWDDRMKKNNFIKTLKKNALEYMMTKIIKADEVISWDNMKDKIIKKYKKDEDAWELVISQTVQKDNEDPQNYATKIEKLCRKMNPNMSEKAIVGKIIKGVLPSIRKELLHRNIKTVDDLEDNLEQIRANKIRYKDESVDILNELIKLRTDLLEKKEVVNALPNQQQKKEEPNAYAQAVARSPNARGYRGRYRGFSRRSYMPRFATPSPFQQPQWQFPAQNFPQQGVFQQQGPCSFCAGPNHHVSVCRKKMNAFCSICGKQGSHYMDTCWYNPNNPQQGPPVHRGRGRGRRGFRPPFHQPQQQPQMVNHIPMVQYEEVAVSKNE